MDTQDFQLLAAVRVPPSRGVAIGVVDIRLDGAAVARLDVVDPFAHLDDLDP
jgi:hypothetical protein